MDVTPLIPQGRQVIQSYSQAGFKVSGVLHEGAVFVFPEVTRNWSMAHTFDALVEADFADLIEVSKDIDVVLLGTGAKMQFFSPVLRHSLKQRGLAVETMDSGAACRTYNVLMAEGRRVVAALLPIT